MSAILKPLPLLEKGAAGVPVHAAGRGLVSEITNPGDTQPHSQQFVAASHGNGTTVTHQPGGVSNFNGDTTQHRNTTSGNNGVSVSFTKGSVVNETGEIQVPVGKRSRLDQGVRATRAHKGLASNVDAGSQGFAAPIEKNATKLPLSVDVYADGLRPGGLPVNVSIK